MPAELTPDLSATVKKFRAAFDAASDNMLAAARVYAAAVNKHGDYARNFFAEHIPEISSFVWGRLEDVGNGVLDPRLIGATGRLPRVLLKLSAPRQAECLDHGVEILLAGGDSLRVQVAHLQPAQLRQVFADGHVRTLAEQRAFQAALKPKPVTVASPFRVRGGFAYFLGNTRMSKQDLEVLLAEMK